MHLLVILIVLTVLTKKLEFPGCKNPSNDKAFQAFVKLLRGCNSVLLRPQHCGIAVLMVRYCGVKGMLFHVIRLHCEWSCFTKELESKIKEL